jgi:hypothetical protein
MKKVALIAIVIAAAFFLNRRSNTAPEPAAVVAQIQHLNQLATVRYTVQKVVGIREPKYPVGEESILLVVQARVEAGVDLSQLTARQVEVERDRVLVRLPPPQILSVSIDERETKVWDRTKTWWTPWVPYSKELEGRARTQGLEEAKKAALEMGILKNAQQNAEASILALLKLAGIREVTIVPAGIS